MSQTSISAPPQAAVPAPQPTPSHKRRRPFGLRAILVLLTILALGDLLTLGMEGADLWHKINGHLPNLVAQNRIEDTVSLAILAVEIVLEVATVIGLWRFRRWAWLLLMFYLGGRMGYGLWQYYDGDANYGAMVINVATVLYLNQREVQRVFAQSSREAT
jgi:hypothetical protein